MRLSRRSRRPFERAYGRVVSESWVVSWWVVSAATTAPVLRATVYPAIQDCVLMGGSH